MNEESSAPGDEPPFGDADAGHGLASADALAAADASALFRKLPGRVVVWMGIRDTGKSTLNCELYERQRRSSGPPTFVGSETLLAFEQRVHSSRAASGRVEPVTERTELDPDGRELLHIALNSPSHGHVHLLLSDVPGEIFRQLRDNILEPTEVALLARADKLVFVADGRRIADPRARALVSSDFRQLLSRLLASGLPDRRSQLALAVTMWDLVDSDVGAKAYWAEREAQLIGELRKIDAEAVVHRVAARAAGAWQGNDGMNRLRSWLLDEPLVLDDPPQEATLWPSSAPPPLRRPKRLGS